MKRRAFGIDLTGSIVLPGTEAGGAATGAPLVLERASRTAVQRAWTGAETHVGAQRIGGRVLSRVVRNERGDLRFRATGIGTFLLRDGATSCLCAPVRDPDAPWLRYLVGQVLPFAALLRDREVLHAGAVELEGGAVAITAPSTGGKSTLLAALVQRGAPLVADDVLALELPDGGELLVHPGPAVLSLRPSGMAPLGGERAVAAIGPPAGAGSTWRVAPRHAEPLGLRALVLLERRPATRGTRLTQIKPVEPQALMATVFHVAWQERQRLVRMLDVLAVLAGTVPVLRLDAAPDVTPAELADAVVRGVAEARPTG